MDFDWAASRGNTRVVQSPNRVSIWYIRSSASSRSSIVLLSAKAPKAAKAPISTRIVAAENRSVEVAGPDRFASCRISPANRSIGSAIADTSVSFWSLRAMRSSSRVSSPIPVKVLAEYNWIHPSAALTKPASYRFRPVARNTYTNQPSNRRHHRVPRCGAVRECRNRQ